MGYEGVVREEEESQMTPEFLTCASEWMVEPSSAEEPDGELGDGKFNFINVTFVCFVRHPDDLLSSYLSQVWSSEERSWLSI